MRKSFDIDVEKLAESNPQVDIAQLQASTQMREELYLMGYRRPGFRLDVLRRPFTGIGTVRRVPASKRSV